MYIVYDELQQLQHAFLNLAILRRVAPVCIITQAFNGSMCSSQHRDNQRLPSWRLFWHPQARSAKT